MLSDIRNSEFNQVSSTGIIEIVRNALTIASVQKNHGGTTGAFRNDALYEWLKSKCPLQEIVSNMKNMDKSQKFYTILGPK